MNFPFFQKKPPENAKLLVWGPTGEFLIMQEGGIGPDVIDAYAAMGQEAAFFNDLKGDAFHDSFMHRGRLTQRPQMLAQIDKHKVRGNGEDSVKIVGAPIGAMVTVRFGQHELPPSINDGVIHFAPPFPGCWIIDIEMPPYLPQRFELIAE